MERRQKGTQFEIKDMPHADQSRWKQTGRAISETAIMELVLLKQALTEVWLHREISD